MDYSDTLYMPGASLKPWVESTGPSDDQGGANEAEAAALAAAARAYGPSTVDSTRRGATTYFFTDVEAGSYKLELRQRVKQKDCGAPVTVTIKSRKAASSAVSLARGGSFGGGLKLYQSQAEEQERPRIPAKLPLDLGT